MTPEARKISIVVPVYNEAANIAPLHNELSTQLESLTYSFEFIFVDDGSTDGSLQIVKDLASRNNNVFYIELSRNFGHQYALKAGLDVSNGDCVV